MTTRKKKEKERRAATCSHNESVFSSKMNMVMTGLEQKRQSTKERSGVEREAVIIAVLLNSNKTDSSDENGTATKMVTRNKNGGET